MLFPVTRMGINQKRNAKKLNKTRTEIRRRVIIGRRPTIKRNHVGVCVLFWIEGDSMVIDAYIRPLCEFPQLDFVPTSQWLRVSQNEEAAPRVPPV